MSLNLKTIFVNIFDVLHIFSKVFCFVDGNGSGGGNLQTFQKRGTYQFVSREAPTEDDENSPNCLINQNYVEIDVNIADLAKD